MEAPADRTGDNSDKGGGAAADQVTMIDRLALADQLAAYGRAMKDPAALAVAADILARNPPHAEEANMPAHAAAPAGATTGKRGSLDSLDAKQLLAEAKQMAGSDQALSGLLRQVEARTAETSRGDVEGPGCFRNFDVDAHSTRWMNITMEGGREAQIWVEGDGDTDVDCWVMDEHGNDIGADTDSTHTCLIEWTPRWTGPFDLKVRNLGDVWTAVRVCTN
jgi:hypothetical protein